MRRVVPLLVALVVLSVPAVPAHAAVDLDRVPRARVLGRRLRLRAARATGRFAATGHAGVGRRHGLARRAHALPPGRESRRCVAERARRCRVARQVRLARARRRDESGGLVPPVGGRRRVRLRDGAADRGLAGRREGLRRRRSRSRGHHRCSRRRSPQQPHRRSHEADPQAPGQRAVRSGRSSIRRCRPT